MKATTQESETQPGEPGKIPPVEKGQRPLGLYKGQFDIGPEFFEPLPDEELALWEHSENDELFFGSK